MPPNEMTCREFVGLIPAYQDNELSRAERQSFAQHMWNCRRCSNYLKGYEKTVKAVKQMCNDSGDPSGAALPKALVSRILGKRLKQQIGS